MTDISPVRTQSPLLPQENRPSRISKPDQSASHKTDSVSLSGPTSRKDVMALVLEKTFSQIQKTGGHGEIQNLYSGRSIKDLQKLESLVQNAKDDLGMSPKTSLNVSPEATANRIADFALLAFHQFQENHPEFGEDKVRTEFVQFIGEAIGQGIEEARDILTGLNALSSEVDADITKTVNIINERLRQFAEQGKAEETSSPQKNSQGTKLLTLN